MAKRGALLDISVVVLTFFVLVLLSAPAYSATMSCSVIDPNGVEVCSKSVTLNLAAESTTSSQCTCEITNCIVGAYTGTVDTDDNTHWVKNVNTRQSSHYHNNEHTAVIGYGIIEANHNIESPLAFVNDEIACCAYPDRCAWGSQCRVPSQTHADLNPGGYDTKSYCYSPAATLPGKWLQCDSGDYMDYFCGDVCGPAKGNIDPRNDPKVPDPSWNAVYAGELNVGQYPNLNTLGCCGDDSEEYYVKEANNEAAFELAFVDGEQTCCSSEHDCAWGTLCKTSAFTPGTPFAGLFGDLNPGGNDNYAFCYNNTKWLECDAYDYMDYFCGEICSPQKAIIAPRSPTRTPNPDWNAVYAGELGVGEYPNMITYGCCGDDANEYYISNVISGVTYTACCDKETDWVDKNRRCRDDLELANYFYGYVTNASDNKPIAGARVTALGGNRVQGDIGQEGVSFFNTTNSSGYYKLFVPVDRVYDLIASKVGFSPNQTGGKHLEFEESMEVNFSLLDTSSPCEPDCTLTSDTACHASCDSGNGCYFITPLAKTACDGKQKGWVVEFNSTHDIMCCAGVPYPKQGATVISSEVSTPNKVRQVRIVMYQGRPIQMVVDVFM